jgi:hypothetical protein
MMCQAQVEALTKTLKQQDVLLADKVSWGEAGGGGKEVRKEEGRG